MVQLAKCANGLSLMILRAFYRQKMSIVFQKAQALFILKCVVVASEGSSRLTTLLKFMSLSFSDMFFAIGGGLQT
jgi:hypothetical protein